MCTDHNLHIIIISEQFFFFFLVVNFVLISTLFDIGFSITWLFIKFLTLSAVFCFWCMFAMGLLILYHSPWRMNEPPSISLYTVYRGEIIETLLLYQRQFVNIHGCFDMSFSQELHTPSLSLSSETADQRLQALPDSQCAWLNTHTLPHVWTKGTNPNWILSLNTAAVRHHQQTPPPKQTRTPW